MKTTKEIYFFYSIDDLFFLSMPDLKYKIPDIKYKKVHE